MIEATLYFSNTSREVRAQAIARTIELFLQTGFLSATITEAIGLWNEAKELGVVAEIILDVPENRSMAANVALTTIAGILAEEFNQNAVKVALVKGSFTLVNLIDHP